MGPARCDSQPSDGLPAGEDFLDPITIAAQVKGRHGRKRVTDGGGGGSRSHASVPVGGPEVPSP